MLCTDDEEAAEAIREAMNSLKNRRVKMAADKFKKALQTGQDGEESGKTQTTIIKIGTADRAGGRGNIRHRQTAVIKTGG